MYYSHFGFNVKPFQINADPAFLWLGEQHTEALSFLRYGVLENRGFLLLTGDVGTGKTTLLNALLQNLDDSNVLVARIPDPRLDLMDFINILADRLGMNESFASRGPFLISFEKFLNRQHYMGRNVLLIIDEAQRLTYELLEEIRALSNLEKPNAKLFNVFFVGQGEFNDMLLDHRSRALRQRITLSYHLEPLNRKEVGEYIRHRQKVAGAQKDLFSKKAVERIYAFSDGFPRLINIICDHALLSAYAGDKKQISEDIVAECARDLEVRSFELSAGRSFTSLGPAGPNKKPESVPAPPAPRHKKTRLAIPALLVLLLIGGYATYQWIPESAGWFVSTTETADTGRPAPGDAESSGTLTMPENTAQPVSANPGAGTVEKTVTGRTEGKSPEETVPRDIRQPDQRAQVEIKPEPTIDIADDPADDPAGPDKPEPEAVARLDPGRYADQKFAVNFPNGAYGLAPDSVETLDRAKRLLLENPGLNADVTGYSDSAGDPQYNLHLSRIRANMVKSYLIGNGVDAGRIDSRGLGSQNPVASNETPQGRARNRRVEIVFNRSSQ
ncbi:MAG: AAA family ATPase [Desulfosalsimonas sp.]|uniref:AAA family ATPase n=1 Tax=Desulfosalsimonas sp. TaxID=3073848 RepID=UPI00397087D1